jgi:hypothetical protein
MTGSVAEARAHHERAVELVQGRPPTRTSVAVRARRWRVANMANEHPSLTEAEEILALAQEFGTTADALNARITLGIGRSNVGDARGVGDLEAALEHALETKSYVAARAYINLGSIVGTIGDLPRSATLHRDGLELSRRIGTSHERWLEAECCYDTFHMGDWVGAEQAARLYFGHHAGQGYTDVMPHDVLSKTAAGRGDDVVARDEGATVLRLAREIGDPQILWSCLAAVARLSCELGDDRQANALLDELAASMSASPGFVFELTFVEAFVAAEAYGRGAELSAQLGKAAFTNPWHDASAAIGSGRHDRAADILDAHGAVSLAALVRLGAGELAGRETPGLRDAAAFYGRVGATAYQARAERVLQASA